MDSEKKNCCTPSAGRTVTITNVPAPNTPADVRVRGNMFDLPGGRFLMGTDYVQGFPADGEGPVRSVVVSSFSIDITPVTNGQFGEFTLATGYVTDAERYG